MAIRTVIVDDERPARDELQFLLRSFPEIDVIAQGKNGIEALALIKEHDPDLVFLDVQMPGLDGFGVIQKLMERKLRVPPIVRVAPCERSPAFFRCAVGPASLQ